MTQPGSVNLPLTQDGATFRLDIALGVLEITVCTPRILRVRLVIDGQPPGPTYVEPRDWDPVNIEVGGRQPTVIDTGAFRLVLEENPLSLVFQDGSGALLLRAPIDDGLVVDSVRRRGVANPAIDSRSLTCRTSTFHRTLHLARRTAFLWAGRGR